MSQYAKYYKILGLPVGASKREVKRAFRRKAMQTHPDKNPNPNAKTLFLEITMAYEILTGQRSLPQQERRKQTQSNPNSRAQNSTSKSDKRKRREERREKMREAKRRKEEAYRNSPQFKKNLAIGLILDQIGYIIAILALLTLPFIFFKHPVMGMVSGIALIPLTYPLWYRAIFTPYNTIEFKQLTLAFQYIYTNTHFKYYLFGVINLLLILNVVFNTFVYFYLVLFIMALPSFILIIKRNFLKQNIKNNLWFKATCIGPLLVNSFFVLNFIFSHSPTNEYQSIASNYSRGSSFFMRFKKDKYKDYPSVRFFMTDRTNFYPHIHLKIEKGVFGIPVLKHYDFVRIPKKKKNH